MEKLLRKSVVKVIGDISWDTHICLFYHTGEEIEAILVPYFQTAHSLETYDAHEILDTASNQQLSLFKRNSKWEGT